jgi:hypothetical protein
MSELLTTPARGFLCRLAVYYILGERLITQLEMTTSAVLSATGRFSISRCDRGEVIEDFAG